MLRALVCKRSPCSEFCLVEELEPPQLHTAILAMGKLRVQDCRGLHVGAFIFRGFGGTFSDQGGLMRLQKSCS